MQHQCLSSIAMSVIHRISTWWHTTSVRNTSTSNHTTGCSCQQPLVAFGRPVRSISQNQFFWCSAKCIDHTAYVLHEWDWVTYKLSHQNFEEFKANLLHSIHFDTDAGRFQMKSPLKKSHRLFHPCLHKHLMMFKFNWRTYHNGPVAHYARY
jgi:hypothetical protein